MICRLIDFALVVLQLLMFKVCGIIGISKIEFFNFLSILLKGLGNQEISRKSLKSLEVMDKYSAGHPKETFSLLLYKNSQNQLYNIPQKNVCYLISRICPQYFVQGCIFEQNISLGLSSCINYPLAAKCAAEKLIVCGVLRRQKY